MKRELIKAVGKSGGNRGGGRKSAYDDSEDDLGGRGGRSLRVGTKVKARYRGKSKFYPGVIARDRGDGTYDIDYDDGEKEIRVKEELIEGGAGGGRSGSRTRKPAYDSEDDGGDAPLDIGDRVEARYKGKSKYYPGVITRSRLGGTQAFDIDYDDGEQEMGVKRELIKAVGKSGVQRFYGESRL